MHASLIYWPVLAQVFLTMMMFIVLVGRRTQAIKDGSADRSKTALDNKAWPDRVVQASNNISNQFELPVLFYVLVLMLVSLDAVTTAALVLAWVFAVSRYIHAYIHTHSNYVPWRMRVYTIGSLSVIGLFVCNVLALV
ncbi:MAPEG family protein [Bacterioplanoides sp.]|uniref:MAPEG family protein n=1 Tax=Bacterioplanoides sp. TaxID=2066072 RepID=UPI003B00556D